MAGNEELPSQEEEEEEEEEEIHEKYVSIIQKQQVWQNFQTKFSQVQEILDQNRILIREINENHESKLPEMLTRNVGLIRELNGNISQIVELYAKLSNDFVQSMEENNPN